MRFAKLVHAVLLPIALCLSQPSIAGAQIYRVAEMNTTQIEALDRQKTVVMLPGGVLEEHGPYMPSFAESTPVCRN